VRLEGRWYEAEANLLRVKQEFIASKKSRKGFRIGVLEKGGGRIESTWQSRVSFEGHLQAKSSRRSSRGGKSRKAHGKRKERQFSDLSAKLIEGKRQGGKGGDQASSKTPHRKVLKVS